ncbi:uncharacterized protein RCO7_10158 [Rhynchosporium graminicola]|uniref:Zn(2)-C6 fungal-type domain-containing protein n=1 Tax=Rhynchosporium graminicola TaxID=2792576 RepID=A0A1E1LKQ0_9HELO|nr:uncharacterized protein RCO7_10158 [Rhynchosporium commune]
MPPRPEKRKRGRREPPKDEEALAPTSPPPVSRFSAINSSQATAATIPIPQPRFAQRPPPPPPAVPSASTPGPSVHGSMSFVVSSAPPGKVAIPALKSSSRIHESSKAQKKGRTPHACDYCRKAKAGCTGGNPCARCLNANVACVYGDGKRDKDKKRLTKLSRESISLSRHNDDVIDALRRIRLDSKLSTEDIRSALDDVISMTPTPVSPGDDEENALRADRDSSEAEDDDDEAASGNEDQDMEVGSTGSLDVTNLDTDRDDTRAIGHIGKSSSVAWAKRTVNAATEREGGSKKSQPGLIVGSYHTEDADIREIDTTHDNYLDWPIPEVADALIYTYFATVHPCFPIIDKTDFMSQYKQFDRASAEYSTEDCIWLGTLNVIFAISAVYAHLVGSPSEGHQSDHLLYLARAKILCFNQTVLFEDARVHTASALGLLCLYFITTCRLNRAWTVCGLAIRHALTLGLHMRNRADELSDYDKECRVRVWWSLYSLECLLNKLTGRPSCISDRDISTPLPLNIDEEELWPGNKLYASPEKDTLNSGPSSRNSPEDSRGSRDHRMHPSATYQMPVGSSQPLEYPFPVLTLPTTTSSYFIYRTQLSIISHEITTQLYCAATIKESWVEVQETVKRIDKRLKAWRDHLPKEYMLDFDRYDEPDWNEPRVLPRMGLAMLFNSSRMLLFRPCLCKFDGRMSAQSEKSMSFNREGVKMCIHAARTMINLIGWTARSVEKLYAVQPWWPTLHYLCEALSVLMLELAYQAQHLPHEAGDILDDAKRGIRWLIMMSEESISARKAWEIFDSLVRIVAPRINWSVYDLPDSAPMPSSYARRGPSNVSGNSTFPTAQQMPRSDVFGFARFDQGMDLSQTHAPNPSTASWAPDAFAFQPSHTFAPPIYGQELIGNPLDHHRAIEMFGSIGSLHGHYDDPWQHFFVGGVGVVGASGVAQGVHGRGLATGIPTTTRTVLPNEGLLGDQMSGQGPGAGALGVGVGGGQNMVVDNVVSGVEFGSGFVGLGGMGGGGGGRGPGSGPGYL